MTNYTFRWGSRAYSITRVQFYAFALPVIGILLAYLLLWVYWGSVTLGHYTGLHPVIAAILFGVLIGSVTLNSPTGPVERRLLPPALAAMLGTFLYGLTLYYLWAVAQWPIWTVGLMTVPGIFQAMAKLRKNKPKSG